MNTAKIICTIFTILYGLTLSCSQPEPEIQTLVVYGDSRSGHQAHREVVSGIMTVKPTTVYHTGDLVNDGRLRADWDTFNNITAPMREAFDFYPALGNHERDDSLYYNNFELPGNERWYSVTEDNIHFIILDSNAPSHDSSEQYLWLENHLMNIDDSVPFIAAVFHHPPYSTGPHTEDEKNLRETFVPLFETYGVDIVFNGHDHCYERSFVNGIYYIVAGGGGAPLYDQERQSPYSQVFLKKYHFCKLTVDRESLKVEVLNPALERLDYYEVNKNHSMIVLSDKLNKNLETTEKRNQ